MPRNKKTSTSFFIPTILVCLGLPLAVPVFAADNPPGSATLFLHPDSLSEATQLPYKYIDPATFLVIQGETDTLQADQDYTLDPTRGVIRWIAKPHSTCTVTFRYLPITTLDEVFHRSMAEAREADTLVSGEKIATLPRIATEDPAGVFADANLKRSGHIFRGVQVGSGRDPSLESGLRLQLGGRVTRDIEVKALLDDRNLPIQPEGSSRRLEEIDQVYVDIKSRRTHARFGDYTLDFEGGRYGTFDRRLEGGQVEYLGSDVQVTAAGAATKAQFHTNTFQGSFGVQGPYSLTGKNGETPILVVGGSEKVYVDGVLRTRGELDDYVIDYSRGEITFMPQLPISSESRIEVQFEYSSEMYPRNVYAGRVAATTDNRKFSAVATMITEGDDKYNPVSFEMTPSTRRAIANAADDASVAAIPAADSLGPGEGDYERRDTTWTDDQSYVYFQWVEPDEDGQPTGSWSVLFSDVGSGNGDYSQQYDAILGAFWYQWEGPGLGDYAPVRLVPKPEQHQLGALALRAEPSDFVSLQSDLAISEYSANTFAESDESSQRTAHESSIALHTRQVNGIRKLESTFTLRQEQSGFLPFGQDEEVDFNRKWGIDSTDETSAKLDQSVFALTVRPWQNTQLKVTSERLEQGNYNSERITGQAAYTSPAVNSNLQVEDIKTDRSADTLQSVNEYHSDWQRANGLLSVRIGHIQPSFNGEWEERSLGTENVNPYGGHRYLRWQPKLTLLDWKGHSGHVAFQRRERDSEVAAETYTDLYDEDTYEAAWSWLPLGAPFRTDVELVHRDKRFYTSDSANVTSDLAQINAFYSPLGGALTTDVQYRLNQTVAQPAAMVAYQVPAGQGEYIRVGEGDAVQYIYDPEIGNYVLRSEPTGDALPTTDLSMTALIDWSPHRLPDGKGEMEGFGWEDISLASEIDVQEVTRWPEPSDIFLLQLGSFQSDSTVSGRLAWKQDVYFWRMSREFSLRMRYDAEKELTNLYVTGAERNGDDALELRARNALTETIDLETEGKYARLYKQLAYSATTERFRQRRLSTEFTWRADRSWTLRLRGRGLLDSRLADADDVLGIGVRPGVIWSIRNKGRVSAEFEALWIETALESVPYELADSRPKGRNGRGSLVAEMQMGEHLTGRATYTVRLDDGREPIHVARMEVSAFF